MTLKWTRYFLFILTTSFNGYLYIDAVIKTRPNIVIIMADDMGFDDVSYRGSNEFLTPNIDALAFNGVILNRHYVPAMCTPSRAALMTGKNPINTGMQHYVIPNDEPWGLPLNETTFAEVFKEAGYFTSLIGKWHLGFSKKAYTPLFRGFDHHYGYLGAYVDYYDQTLYFSSKPYARGYDFRNNLNSSRENQGNYVTDILTEEAERLISSHKFDENPLLMIMAHLAPHSGNDDYPLQAPDAEIQKFNHIPDLNRRTYAAMVSKLDESVGKVIEALNTKGVLDNTIILFYSDNGAPCYGMHTNFGSNYPLRGQKNSPWEGGVRSPAAIWSTLIPKRSTISEQTMHISDWLPTLASAAGITVPKNLILDGLNLWPSLTKETELISRKIVHNIDDIYKYVSYMSGPWKYVNGTTLSGKYDFWLRPRDSHHIEPISRNYENIVKESVAWKNLEQHNLNDMVSADILELRQKAEVTCAAHKEILKCKPLRDECIFNIEDDPCEQNNLIEEMRGSNILKRIRNEVENLRTNAKIPVRKNADPKCDPKLYDSEWTWWEDT